ncbi:MAG: fibronectin type III domain-containing protein [Dehalococcoidia bacterium]|nr:fibronectin type III domain-containing protein [Dehalococcoidia bacterium]
MKKVGSNKKAVAGMLTAFLVLTLALIGFATEETTGSPYGYGGGGGGEPRDTTPPVISGESASDVTDTSATISWITDEPSTSQVEYWPGSLSALDKTLVTSHSVTLTNLAPGTTYYYKTMSADDAGNLAVSDEYTFTTLAAPAPANWALIGGIIAGVVVAGGLAWYLLWWRRRGSYIG